jgi:hypothetical protein
LYFYLLRWERLSGTQTRIPERLYRARERTTKKVDELTIAAVLFCLIGGYFLLKNSGVVSSDQGDPQNFDPSIVSFAQAIAVAEGANTAYNNPGDLKVNQNLSDLLTAGWSGSTAPSGITIYDTPGAGWNALYNQILFIVNGKSALGNLQSSISDLAYNYTTTQQDEWAQNVTDELNSMGITDSGGNQLTPDTLLGEFLQ